MMTRRELIKLLLEAKDLDEQIEFSSLDISELRGDPLWDWEVGYAGDGEIVRAANAKLAIEAFAKKYKLWGFGVVIDSVRDIPSLAFGDDISVTVKRVGDYYYRTYIVSASKSIIYHAVCTK